MVGIESGIESTHHESVVGEKVTTIGRFIRKLLVKGPGSPLVDDIIHQPEAVRDFVMVPKVSHLRMNRSVLGVDGVSIYSTGTTGLIYACIVLPHSKAIGRASPRHCVHRGVCCAVAVALQPRRSHASHLPARHRRQRWPLRNGPLAVAPPCLKAAFVPFLCTYRMC